MYFKKPTKHYKRLNYYEHFYAYVQKNNYTTYCNAVEYAMKQTDI